MAAGAARGVVVTWCRSGPQLSLMLGAGLQGAVHCRCELAGPFLPLAPGFPGGAFWQGREGKRRGRRAARDAVAGTGAGMTGVRAGGHLSCREEKTRPSNESAMRTGRAKPGKGNRYPAAVTG